MRKFTVSFLSVLYLLGTPLTFAATVSCEVKEVLGSTLVLKNCDAKRLVNFKKGHKVKVKMLKKQL